MDRRGLLGAIGAAALMPSRGWAAAVPTPPSDRLFADTPFATNRVGRSFARVDLALPDARVLTASGDARLRRVVRGPCLLTLWSEWCVPCLVEARDLAALRPRVAGGGFDIVSLLTGSVARLDHPGAVARLAKAGAAGLTVVAEPAGAHLAADALAADPPSAHGPKGGYSLPCTLLVDRHGRVRGRAFGIATFHPAVPGAPRPAGTVVTVPHVLTEAEKQAMMGADSHTVWATPDGEALLLALRGGLLDRPPA